MARTCFNCGGDHFLSQCPKPIDPVCVEKAKQEFLAQKKASFGYTPKPQHKFAKDGHKLTLNEKGLYIHNVSAKSKSDKAEKKATQKT